jgi:hypothetical protein
MMRSNQGDNMPHQNINHTEVHRIALAGVTGDLGGRIGRALLAQGARVDAIVRPGTAPEQLAALRAQGFNPVAVDMADAAALRDAVRGARCVVSALNGLEPVVIGLQQRLLDAAVAAGVARFIPSDYSLDFTKTHPGENRNLDLRRRFMASLDAAPIQATSILNGGFIDLLAGQAPILRIAGVTVSPADLARIMTELTGRRYATLRMGGIGALSAVIAVARTLTPASDAPFPAWQGMQYLRDMMSGRGKLAPLDNDRYGQRPWTKAREVLAETFVS